MGELDALPARELERWAQYWSEEPWGAYRDNLHAALIASELWKVNLDPKERAKVSAANFMFEHEDDLKERAKRRFVAELIQSTRKKSR